MPNLNKGKKKNNMTGLLTKKWIKVVSFLLLGGLGGFAYYYFIGCNSGTCAITSNPYISTTYGMMMGLLLSIDSKKEKNKTDA
jgi:hypothetical protein